MEGREKITNFEEKKYTYNFFFIVVSGMVSSSSEKKF